VPASIKSTFYVLCLFLLLIACSAAREPIEVAQPRVTLTGVVAFTETGAPEFMDCAAKAKVALDMTTGNYMFFKRRAGQLNRRVGQPVIAEMSGYLHQTSTGPQLERAALLSLNPGVCPASGAAHTSAQGTERTTALTR
jgi:hypothetical protein